MTKLTTDKTLLLILRIGAFCCFAGWTWVHFYWEGPYGSLLWQDSTFNLADRFGVSWDEFVGTGANDGLVQKWIGGIAWLFLGCTVLSLIVRKKPRAFLIALLVGGAGLMTFLAYAKYVSAQRQLPMLIEHGGQILSPVLLGMALWLGVRHQATIWVAIVACMMTFAGHGAYALGSFWPTPASFYGMTTVILHVDFETAKMILRLAGVLDFLVCVGLLIPAIRSFSAMYAVIWGFLTALARPVAGMALGLNYWGADQFIHEAVLRAPHFMIPFYLWALWRKRKTDNAPEEAVQTSETANIPL